MYLFLNVLSVKLVFGHLLLLMLFNFVMPNYILQYTLKSQDVMFCSYSFSLYNCTNFRTNKNKFFEKLTPSFRPVYTKV